MLYVVVREIEGGSEADNSVFTNRNKARTYYARAHKVCDNDPDEFGEGDPSIVCRCWLYVVNTDDASTARAMVRDGRAVLVASYPEADFHDGETR